MSGTKQFSTYNAFFPAADKRNAAWLYAPETQALLALLEEDGGEARVIGGAVRDALLGRAPGELDIAVSLLPEETLARAKARGFKTAAYAAEFGTVLVVINGKSFEVTSLRQDIAADGRRATVRFCRDWALDAARRDFTINALSADRRGTVYDYAGGLADIKARRLRFIGAPPERIKEDYLRILRFFRFYALLGQGRPDAAALKAIAALKGGIKRLSPERIWDELKKILALEDPFRALLWMRTAGVLSLILPESGKWGIDALPGLLKNERDAAAAQENKDPLRRLMAMIPPRLEAAEAAAARLRLSAKEKQRLIKWAEQMPLKADCSALDLQKRLYAAQAKTGAAGEQTARRAVADALAVAAASARAYGKAKDSRAFARSAVLAETLPVPRLPVTGADLSARGFRGAEIGKALKKLGRTWINSGFQLDRAALLASL